MARHGLSEELHAEIPFFSVIGRLMLMACAPGTKFQTMSGSRAFLSDTMAVDIVEASFNIPFVPFAFWHSRAGYRPRRDLLRPSIGIGCYR